MQIKIIDDDAGDIEVLMKALKTLPMVKSVGANYGYEAGCDLVNFCRDLPTLAADDPELEPAYPDVIIFEAKLAGGSSVDLIRQAHQCPTLAATRLVVYTNTDDDAAKQACLAAGATKVFSKGPGTKGAEALAAYVVTLNQKGG